MFPHGKREPEEFGHSPGNGITPMSLSQDPLATEGEATSGPDDYNPFEDEDMTSKRDPTEDPDPFVFDDVADGSVAEPDFPDLGAEPDDSVLDLF